MPTPLGGQLLAQRSSTFGGAVGACPNSSPGAAHAAVRTSTPSGPFGAAGLCAVATAIGVGAVVDAPPPPSATTMAHHGVKTCPGDSAVSAAGSRPASPHPRTMAHPEAAGRSVPAYVLLSGLGYPASPRRCWSAQPIRYIDARPAMLLVIPADADKLAVLRSRRTTPPILGCWLAPWSPA